VKNKIKLFSLLIIVFPVFVGCVATDKNEIVAVEDITTQVEEIVLEPFPVIQDSVDEEYKRSTENLVDVVISADDFTADKAKIMEIISELEVIMKNVNYNSWIRYLTNASIQYWSSSANLYQVSQKLPVKGLKLRSLEDYFKFVFIPSRIGREVTEIRYISPTLVKAVQVSENTDIIYYNFEKINNKWYIKLETLES
jgi:hypothetical protein